MTAAATRTKQKSVKTTAVNRPLGQHHHILKRQEEDRFTHLQDTPEAPLEKGLNRSLEVIIFSEFTSTLKENKPFYCFCFIYILFFNLQTHICFCGFTESARVFVVTPVQEEAEKVSAGVLVVWWSKNPNLCSIFNLPASQLCTYETKQNEQM